VTGSQGARHGPAAPITDRQKMRLLPWAYTHSALNSVFSALTLFGPVFILFLDELGMPKARIGLVLSLLPFSGLLAPCIAGAVARLGVKRVFIVCWGLRKVVAAVLLVLPWCVQRRGVDAAFLLLAATVAAFALLRAVAETAWYPWFHEVVPLSYRGRFNGINNFVTMLASSVALVGSSWVLAHVQGLERFTWLIGIGVVFGLLCVLAALPIPGGAPLAGSRADSPVPGRMRQAMADRRFRWYLVYAALAIVALNSMLMAFLPLFLKQQVRLSERQVILLQIAAYVTGLLSSQAWGSAADQRGSRAVSGTALGGLTLIPLLWTVIPRAHPWSLPLAVAITAGAGLLLPGWWIGDQRLLYVEIVPRDRRTEYMALYYAWIGLVGGCGPLLAGWLLDRLRNLSGTWGIVSLDPYLPLFVLAVVLLALAQLALRRLPNATAAAAPAPAPPGRG